MPPRPSPANNLSLHPVAKEFHYEKNYPLKPEDFTIGSKKKIWWQCLVDASHEWETQICNRTNKNHSTSCPFCLNKKPSSTNNLSLHPVAKEFHYEKNYPLKPEDFTIKSNKKVWWRCPQNLEHVWIAIISSRTYKDSCGCPYCSGKKPSEDNNLSLHQIAKEFHYERNAPLKPEDFTLKSNKKIWWKCEKGHEWESSVNNRNSNNQNGCPYCSGRLSTKENNISLHPIVKEFDYDKNHPLTPEDFLPKSHRKIWWKCSKGHGWKASIYNRTRSYGNGCPYCTAHGTSLIEMKILNFIASLNLNPIHRYKLDGVEADIFIPDKNLAIEFNGLYWHSSLFKDKKYHYTKYKHFRDRGIQLIQIWEDEWKDKQNIVKSILLQKLGVSPIRIYARKCSFVEGDFSQFIEDNHISGNVRADKYLGLEYLGELVAAMSLRKPFHKKWSSYTEIARFCTKQNTAISGGLSKLLKRASGPLLTYADCRLGSGDSYETVGFKRDGHTGVSLEWTNGTKRFNRFKFKAGNGKTQKEVAQENSVVELWGPGNIRFIK